MLARLGARGPGRRLAAFGLGAAAAFMPMQVRAAGGSITSGVVATTTEVATQVYAPILDGGTYQGDGSTYDVSQQALSVTSNGGTIDSAGNTLLLGTLSDASSVGGTLTITNSHGGGVIDFTAASTITGSVVITSSALISLWTSDALSSASSIQDDGFLYISQTSDGGAAIISLGGNGKVRLGNNTLTITNGANTFSGVVSDTGALIVSGGTETLSGTNTYTGATTITGGTLALSGSGSVARSSVVSVNAGGTFDISGTTSGASIKSLSGSGAVALGSETLTLTNGANTFSGVVSGTGGLAVAGGTETLSGTNTYTGATTITGGTLALSGSGSVARSSVVSVNAGGTFDISGTTSGASIKSLSGSGAVALGSETLTLTNGANTFSGVVSGTGGLIVSGGTEVLSGTNTYTGATTITGGTLALSGNGSIADSSVVSVNAGSTFDISGTTSGAEINSLSGSGAVALGSETLTLTNGANTFSGDVSGTGGLAVSGGTEVLSGANLYTGATNVTGGALALSGSGSIADSSVVSVNAGGTFDISGTTSGASIKSLSGSGAVALGSKTLTLTNGANTFSGVVSGTGGLTVAGGTEVLSGFNLYTGATTITGGTLEVDGSIANSSSVTVESGGTLSGIGTVDPEATTIMSGGTLAPGNAADPTGTLTITGDLVFQSGATYQVQVTPSAAASTSVSGTATLAGTVSADFANGSYISKTYTILTATGGISGTFSSLTNVNLPANFSDSLSYDAEDVYLNLTLNFETPSGALTVNQQNVANALTNYFNTNGGIATKFATLSAAALSEVDGEANTGAERAAFQLESGFLNAMLDPFVAGRFGSEGPSNIAAGDAVQPLGYMSEQAFMPRALALAYGRVLKAPAAYLPHWSVWGTAYGGVGSTDGNAASGANQLNANTYGFVAGLDYHVSADTIVGFSLGGGGTNWTLATVGGGGHSEALQTGLYGITRSGPLYGAVAFGFTNNWFNTDRTALGDQLRANFGGQSYGGRLEGGYHLSGLPIGVTPYAAVQAQDYVSPNYREADITGGGYGLSYAAMSATDVRTEIGARFADTTALGARPLVLFGKLAWAHDFASNPSLSAAFESLPGESFLVNGAPIAHNSALVSSGAELILAAHWSVQAKFDGEFASSSRTYGGTGTLKYTW